MVDFNDIQSLQSPKKKKKKTLIYFHVFNEAHALFLCISFFMMVPQFLLELVAVSREAWKNLTSYFLC